MYTYFYLSFSFILILVIPLYFVKWNMSENAQVEVEAHVWYSVTNKTIKVFLTHTCKLDELKAQLNWYFVHICENQITSHVFVQVSCVNLGEDKDEDSCKTVYFSQVICDDGNVNYMFRLMVENNILYLCVLSIEV